MHRREADEDGRLGAEDAAAKDPGAGVGGELLALGVGEAAFGADEEHDSLGRLDRQRCRVAAIVEEQAHVGRREQGRGEERVERCWGE